VSLLEVQKVHQYPIPAYPDKEEALHNPAMLLSMPERWKYNAKISAALAATSALLLTAGCTVQTSSSSKPTAQTTASATPGKPAPSPTFAASASPSPVLTATALAAIPFFTHGTGRGAFGCDSVAPPAFLSEAEALEVINEVAAQEGLHFELNGQELKNINIPKTSTEPSEKNPVLGYKKGTLTLDGVDSAKKVAFEFVSQEDIEAWCAAPSGATVTSYDFIDTAKALSDSLSKTSSGMTVAVFYDPGYTYNDEVKKIVNENQESTTKQAKLKDVVKNDLRQQVRDFMAWLKAEGIV
jgi:hypothetical protein